MATAASTITSSGGSHHPPNNNTIQQQWSNRVVATAASTITSSGGSHRPPNNNTQQHSPWLDNKTRNRLNKMTNGNIQNIKNIKVIHWNLGARLWQNKLVDIEALINEFKPDLLFVTEANLWNNLPEQDRQVPGHTLYLPLTMNSLGYARIVLVARTEIDLNILNQHMDDQGATIWVQIGKGRNKMTVGGIYREHVQLARGETHDTWMERQARQVERWRSIVNKWRMAGRQSSSTVIGDLNLNYLRWENPEAGYEEMIEMVQDELEVEGFTQLMTGYTRNQRNQEDSLLDHVWTNRRDRILGHANIVRGSSDHHVISVDISCRNIRVGGQTTRRRVWKQFDKVRCLNKFRETDWSDILTDLNIETATYKFEEKVRNIIESEAPMKTVQLRTHYNVWITDNTKMTMARRDTALSKARTTDTDSDWMEFHTLRNKCTSLQKKDRTNHFRKLYNEI